MYSAMRGWLSDTGLISSESRLNVCVEIEIIIPYLYSDLNHMLKQHIYCLQE